MSSSSSDSENFNKKLEQIWSDSSEDTSKSESETTSELPSYDSSLHISDSISNHPGFEEFIKQKQEREEEREWKSTLISFIKIDINNHKDVIPEIYTNKSMDLNTMTVGELETVTRDLNKIISAASIQPEDAIDPSTESESSKESDSMPSIFTVSSDEQ